MATTEKQRLIVERTESARLAFTKWANIPDHQLRLDIPENLLLFLIPPRLLEVVPDPGLVRVVPFIRDAGNLDFLLIEENARPLSNPDSLAKYCREMQAYDEQVKDSKPMQHQGNIGEPSIRHPERPPDVNKYHADLWQFINEGKMGPNSEVTHLIDLYRRTPNTLLVGNYQDNKYRGQGVTLSFYARLAEAAKLLGFRIIEGANTVDGTNPSDSLTFFTDKLGRFRLSELKPEYQRQLQPYKHETNPELVTIQFLYEEDKKHYLAGGRTSLASIKTSLKTRLNSFRG